MTVLKKKKQFSKLADIIKKEFKAKEVILFGSYAYGKPSESSDVDILVILNTNLKPYQQAALIRVCLSKEIGMKFPMDLMVRTPQQIKERLQLGDFFIGKIMNKGVYL